MVPCVSSARISPLTRSPPCSRRTATRSPLIFSMRERARRWQACRRKRFGFPPVDDIQAGSLLGSSAVGPSQSSSLFSESQLYGSCGRFANEVACIDVFSRLDVLQFQSDFLQSS